MNDDDIFDGAVPVAPGERGESFSMSAVCYKRMAECAMRAMQYGHVEPVLIRRLRSGAGCELLCFGQASAYTLHVDASTSPAAIILSCIDLDSHQSGPGDELCRGYDQPETWHSFCDTMIWREGNAGSEELAEWQDISDYLRKANDWGWM